MTWNVFQVQSVTLWNVSGLSGLQVDKIACKHKLKLHQIDVYS